MCKQLKGKRNLLSGGMKPMLHWRGVVYFSKRERKIAFLLVSLNEIELFIARQLL